VSRGLIKSRTVRGSRAREYSGADIERLATQKRARRDPAAAGRRALAVDGLPVLSSALTLIEDGRLYYRGQDAVRLSRDARFEDVAALLWDGPLESMERPERPGSSERRAVAKLPFAARAQCHLALLQERDVRSHDLSAAGVRRTGTCILTELTSLAVAVEHRSSVAASLGAGWGLGARRAERALDAALILCADHELNVSAFTARAIASAGATPYMAVSGALAALSGHRHGGVGEQVLGLLDERATPEHAIAERLSRGESIPGFGHPLYPDGDPRARRLLELCPRGAERAHALAFAAAVESSIGSRPNLDFGLAAVCRSFGLPPHAPFVLFALGRTAGWVAHAIEQYQTGELIRPRARYVGLSPGGSWPGACI